MEAKKQGVGEDELSMEEILQSIRRIISDDDDDDKSKGENASGKEADLENPVPTSDILELTDMIADDGTVTNIKEAANDSAGSMDVLDNIDAALAPATLPPTPAPTPQPVAEIPEKIPVPKPAPQPIKSEEISNDELDRLLSQAAESATLSSLAKIPQPEIKKHISTESPYFRSGETVEDLVENLLRPMLKEWLDTNLPNIVENIVEREVTRLTRR